MNKLVLFAIFSISSCFAALPEDKKESSDKDQIKLRLEQFSNVLNQGNVEAIPSFWTSNAEVITPITGQVIEGRSAVNQYLQDRLKKLSGKQISFNPKTIEFPENDSATVEGLLQISDHGKVVSQQARRIGLVKVNGQWNLDFLSEIPVDPAPTSYNHLKDLEWLTGHWIDEDDNVTIQFKGRWDKFKNFIVQNFVMDIYGVETLEGLQIIGWDPIEKTVRGWVYDSDGGFGSAIWSKIEGGWSAKLTYTLSDGATASSTNIYTQIQDKSYSYSSIDRKVGTQKLPNIDPVTVYKE